MNLTSRHSRVARKAKQKGQAEAPPVQAPVVETVMEVDDDAASDASDDEIAAI